MRGHSVCFCWEIRKIIVELCQYPLLSGALRGLSFLPKACLLFKERLWNRRNVFFSLRVDHLWELGKNENDRVASFKSLPTLRKNWDRSILQIRRRDYFFIKKKTTNIFWPIIRTVFEMVLIRGNNICFHWEIRKFIFELSSVLPLIWNSVWWD